MGLDYRESLTEFQLYGIISVLPNRSNRRRYSITEKGFLYFPVKRYKNAYLSKEEIRKENRGRSGIYLWRNNINGKCYVGSGVNLGKRFKEYFSLKYLAGCGNMNISKALMKYGYFNFSIEILEYCDKSQLISREQYYMDLLKPEYNILKVAGSSLGFKHSEESRKKMKGGIRSPEHLENIRKGTKRYHAEGGYSSESRARMTKGAAEFNKRTKGIKVAFKNIETQEVKIFASMNEAYKEMKISSNIIKKHALSKEPYLGNEIYFLEKEKRCSRPC